jgi:hypothetical protein
MKTLFKILIIGAVTWFLPGCRLHKVKMKEIGKATDKQNYHFNYDPSRRGSLLLYDAAGNYKILSEVQPDAIVSQVTDIASKLTAKIKGQDISGENATKIAESVSELGKRSIAGGILRDALYRLQEMSISTTSITVDQKELFNKVLAVAEKIALAEVQAEEAKKEGHKADAEKHKAKQEEEKARQSESDKERASYELQKARLTYR